MKNKEVAAILTPPLPAVGFTTTESAPRGRKPQVPELRIRVEYDLAAYYPAGRFGDGNVRPVPNETRYSLAPDRQAEATTDAERSAAVRHVVT